MANAQAIIDMEEYQKLKQSDITLNKIWEILSKNEFKKDILTGNFYQTIQYEAMLDFAKREKFTDIYLIDEDFLRSAIENEIKRRKCEK